MLLVQERTGRPKASKPSNSDASRVDDGTIEDELVSLLGRLDFLREKMVLAHNDRNLILLLSLAEELLKQVSAFSQQHVPLRSSLEMKAAESKADEFRSFFQQIKNREKPQADEAIARQAFQALQEAMLAYFSTCTRRFSTSLAARSWVDVAATFVVDLQLVPLTVMSLK